MGFRCNAVLGRVRLATAAALILGVMVSVVLSTESAASVDTVQFSTSPALSPAFDPTISDYVVRLTSGTNIQVTVTNTAASDTTTTVSVDGQTPRTGAFTTTVGLNYSQGFKITAVQGATSKDFYVRRLPSGFPTWTSQRLSLPQTEYYLVAPSLGSGATGWVILYDTNAVPMWWSEPASNLPLDSKLVQDGGPDVLWTDMQNGDVNSGPEAEEHRLDGTLAQTVHITSSYTLNPHEVQLLSNGNYLVIGGYAKSGVNLSSIGGATSATILDDVVQEVTSNGTAVWTWDAYDHVGINEVDPQWWSTATSGTGTHDVYHINSAVADSSSNLLVSLRFTDAVFYITNPGASTNPGKIIWKLGGTATQKDAGTILSITDAGCTGSCFGGQHYARFFDAGDGNLYVTLHDNGTGRSRAPRAVRYQINTSAGTATRVEQVTDSVVTAASCCGSAKKLPNGHWVMSWGANPLVAEYSSGSRVFSITFSGPYSYRADPVPPGTVTREQLRAGMDAQYPRPVSNTPPTISAIANQVINEDTATAALAFTVGDAQTAAGSLTLGQGSSNTTLVPTNNIVFGGSGASRTVTVTPATNQNGSATITVSVSDGQLSTNTSFLLTVNPVNDPPTISAISNQTIYVNGTNGPLNFTVGDVETPAGSLTLRGDSSNLVLVPTNNIVFGGSDSNRTVTVTPAANQSGTSTITISVSDGALSASNSFVLTVNVQLVIVPNVVNQTQTVATNAIISAGLSVGIISNAPDGIVPAGSVISQNPAAATSVPIGSPVDLIVSSGATVPQVSEVSYQDGVFQAFVPTLSGRTYTLQFIDDLTRTNWTDLQSVSGDGTLRVFIDSSATNAQRFYRVHIQ